MCGARMGAASRHVIRHIERREGPRIYTSFPSLGFVQRAGHAYRWLPLTYQLQA